MGTQGRGQRRRKPTKRGTQRQKGPQRRGAAKEKAAKAAERAAKEKADKAEKAAKAAERASKERASKERDTKNTCTVTAYEHNNYGGRVESRNSVCRPSQTNIRFKPYALGGRRRGYWASSFKLSSGCKQVQLWDEDACRYNYSDNVNIKSSVGSVKWDLNDDICGITVWSKCRL